MFHETPFTIVALLVHPSDGTLLSVSRKTDHDDLGLPGGKIEPGETPEQALVREVFEETGVRILAFEPCFQRPCGPLGPSRCYRVLAWEGIPFAKENAWVGWVTPERLLEDRNSFKDYNRALFDYLGPALLPATIQTPVQGTFRPLIEAHAREALVKLWQRPNGA